MDLLQEYEVSRALLRQQISRETDEQDLKILNSMLRDLDYAIKWLEVGHEPKPGRAIHTYKHEILFDTTTLEIAFSARAASPFMQEATDEYQAQQNDRRIAQALSHLKPRDRELYVMHYAGLKSCTQIAEATGVNRETIKKVLQRSRKKIAQALIEA